MQFSLDSLSMLSKKLMGLLSFIPDPRLDLPWKSCSDLRNWHNR